MTTLDEKDLRFHFDDSWSDLTNYERIDVRRASSKNLTCIDILGVQHGSKIFLIEVKNFKNRHASQYPSIVAKLSPDSQSNDDKESPLLKTIVKNIKDSLLFLLLYAKRNETEEARFWANMGDKLAQRDKDIYVVLWLELDSSYRDFPPEILQIAQTAIANKLAQRLSWLSGNVFVASTASHPFGDSLTVEFI